jgi:hypothetical protein
MTCNNMSKHVLSYYMHVPVHVITLSEALHAGNDM